MGSKLGDTLTEMSELAQRHSCVAVAYSGGKDSMVTLDLAMRHFDKVVPFYLYFLPHMEFDAQRMAFCKRRFGLDVMQYPHFNTIRCFKTGTYCDPLPEFDDMPELDVRVLYDVVKGDTGATLIVNGQKKADGIFRRRMIANTKNTQPDVYRPLKNWVRWEILSYLQMRDLPLPSQAQGDNAGISLAIGEVLHLYDNHRSDYDLMQSFFPYIETIVLRREWFGLTSD